MEATLLAKKVKAGRFEFATARLHAKGSLRDLQMETHAVGPGMPELQAAARVLRKNHGVELRGASLYARRANAGLRVLAGIVRVDSSWTRREERHDSGSRRSGKSCLSDWERVRRRA